MTDRLFIELQVQHTKISSSNLERTCCVQKLFPQFRTIFEHNLFCPCSAKRIASDEDLLVPTSTCICSYHDLPHNGIYWPPFFSDARAINVTDSGSEDTEAEHKNEFLFKPCDNATEFQCTTSSLCVPKYWLCDGTVRTIKL